MKKEILKLHADFCRVFSNSTRLEILCLLRSGELTVNEITAKPGIPKANTSQHLALMRTERILTARRKGQNVYYGIAPLCHFKQRGKSPGLFSTGEDLSPSVEMAPGFLKP